MQIIRTGWVRVWGHPEQDKPLVILLAGHPLPSYAHKNPLYEKSADCTLDILECSPAVQAALDELFNTLLIRSLPVNDAILEALGKQRSFAGHAELASYIGRSTIGVKTALRRMEKDGIKIRRIRGRLWL